MTVCDSLLLIDNCDSIGFQCLNIVKPWLDNAVCSLKSRENRSVPKFVILSTIRNHLIDKSPTRLAIKRIGIFINSIGWLGEIKNVSIIFSNFLGIPRNYKQEMNHIA